MSLAINMDRLDSPRSTVVLDEPEATQQTCPNCHQHVTYPLTTEGTKKAKQHHKVILAIARIAIPIILILAALGGMGYWAYTEFSGTITNSTALITNAGLNVQKEMQKDTVVIASAINGALGNFTNSFDEGLAQVSGQVADVKEGVSVMSENCAQANVYLPKLLTAVQEMTVACNSRPPIPQTHP